MLATEIQEHARMLFAARGDKAAVEAAQRAAALEKRGDKQGAVDWRRIEAALRLMQGPRAT
jgi:hypothetical protein